MIGSEWGDVLVDEARVVLKFDVVHHLSQRKDNIVVGTCLDN